MDTSTRFYYPTTSYRLHIIWKSSTNISQYCTVIWTIVECSVRPVTNHFSVILLHFFLHFCENSEKVWMQLSCEINFSVIKSHVNSQVVVEYSKQRGAEQVFCNFPTKFCMPRKSKGWNCSQRWTFFYMILKIILLRILLIFLLPLFLLL